MKYIKKIIQKLFWVLDKITPNMYRKVYPSYLSWLGVDIDYKDYHGTWISPTVFFDSTNYEMISIGKCVTISFDVAILTHDYSIIHGAKSINKKTKDIIRKEVKIGNNVFIGARTLILPGSVIEDDCIIGGGSVVRGRLQSQSVYAGNPAKRICSVNEYIQKHQELIIDIDYGG